MACPQHVPNTECADWRDVAISLNAHKPVLLGFISNLRPHAKKGNHWLLGRSPGELAHCGSGIYFSAKILLFSSYNRILCLYNKIYLADFLKTNLTKFAVISSKRRQKAGFLNLRSSMVTKEKERRKRKSEEKKRRRREKSDGYTLSFCNSHFGDRFWPRKTVGRKRLIWQ